MQMLYFAKIYQKSHIKYFIMSTNSFFCHIKLAIRVNSLYLIDDMTLLSRENSNIRFKNNGNLQIGLVDCEFNSIDDFVAEWVFLGRR